MSTSTTASGDGSAPSLNGLVVMISHASKHLPTTEDEHGKHPGLAESVYERLNALGATVLLDKRCLVPGDDWNQEIYVGWINECDAAIVLMSDKALESNPVRDEATVLRNRHRLGTMPALLPIFIDKVDETVLREKWGDTSQWSDLSAKKVAASADVGTAAQAIVDAFCELAKKHDLTRLPAGPVVTRAQHHAKPLLPDSTRDNVLSALRTATEKLRPDPFDATKLDTAALRGAAAHAWCISTAPIAATALLVDALFDSGEADVDWSMSRLIEFNVCGVYDLPTDPFAADLLLRAGAGGVLPCRSQVQAQLGLKAIRTGHNENRGADQDRIEIAIPSPTTGGINESVIEALETAFITAFPTAEDDSASYRTQLSNRAKNPSRNAVFALIFVGETHAALVDATLPGAIAAHFKLGLLPLFYGPDPGRLARRLELRMLSVFSDSLGGQADHDVEDSALERFLAESSTVGARQTDLLEEFRFQHHRVQREARR